MLRRHAIARHAGALRAAGRPRQSLALLDEELSHGDEAGLLIERAAALQELARFDEAEVSLDQALPHDRLTTFAAKLVRGSVELGRGAYDEAEMLLADADADADADAFAREAFGSRSLEAAAAANARGITCKFAGRFDEGHARRVLRFSACGVLAEPSRPRKGARTPPFRLEFFAAHVQFAGIDASVDGCLFRCTLPTPWFRRVM